MWHLGPSFLFLLGLIWHYQFKWEGKKGWSDFSFHLYFTSSWQPFLVALGLSNYPCSLILIICIAGGNFWSLPEFCSCFCSYFLQSLVTSGLSMADFLTLFFMCPILYLIISFCLSEQCFLIFFKSLFSSSLNLSIAESNLLLFTIFFLFLQFLFSSVLYVAGQF